MTLVRDASSDMPSTVLKRAGVFPDAAPGCVPTDELTEFGRNGRVVLALAGLGIVRILGERGAVRSSSDAAMVCVSLVAGTSVAIARRANRSQPRIEIEGSAHHRAADRRLDRAPRSTPGVGTVLAAIHRRRVRGSKPVLGVEHDQ